MEPRNPSLRKSNEEPLLRDQRKLSVRTALMLTLALLIALGDAALLRAAHQAIPLIVISAVVAFVAALKLLDGVIE
jgi:hypothetical protein